MDQGLGDLAALAEYVTARRMTEYDTSADEPAPCGRTAGQWASVFEQARILHEKLAVANARAKSTLIGHFFSGKLDRRVEIEGGAGLRWATLRKREAAGRQKLYFFEIADQPPGTTPACPMDELVTAGGEPGGRHDAASERAPDPVLPPGDPAALWLEE
jgi:hypothetical protein